MSCEKQQQGRGSAGGPTNIVQLLVLIILILHLGSTTCNALTYTVGDSGGWTFNTNTWPTGKHFRAGDVLLFKYDPTLHNVVAVDRGGYTGCTTPSGAKVFKSGNDRIKLGRGQNYFICNFPGHCDSAMKIAITAV